MMPHVASYVPTHQQMSRIEHAIVVNRRRYYALRESGQLDRAEEARLELDYLNLSWWKYHPQPRPAEIPVYDERCREVVFD